MGKADRNADFKLSVLSDLGLTFAWERNDIAFSG